MKKLLILFSLCLPISIHAQQDLEKLVRQESVLSVTWPDQLKNSGRWEMVAIAKLSTQKSKVQIDSMHSFFYHFKPDSLLSNYIISGTPDFFSSYGTIVIKQVAEAGGWKYFPRSCLRVHYIDSLYFIAEPVYNIALETGKLLTDKEMEEQLKSRKGPYDVTLFKAIKGKSRKTVDAYRVFEIWRRQ